MSKLNSVNTDVLKRPRVLGAIGAVIVLIVAFYFAWWTPETNKLASVNAQKQQQVTEIASLHAQLAQLIAEAGFVTKYQTFLTFFGSQVPVQPEQGQLVYQLGKLSNSDHVDITSVTANTTSPAVAPSTLSTIPVSLTVTGAHANVDKFLSDLYSLPRLITIQSINPTPTAAPNPAYDVLNRDNVPFTMTISGTAYFAGTVTPAPAG
ncbi:MAG TPA: type 4a pilus biogenesis protein PilO [Acidimicrobiales bacterium]|nr:type 4a pilus biogenesis protein PilO [Acidimicrobiales bacterium]